MSENVEDRLLAIVEKLADRLANPPDPVVIIREIMQGFKSVMQPEIPTPEPPADIYTADPNPVPEKDPAWEIWPDSYLESQLREMTEDSMTDSMTEIPDAGS